MALLDDPSVPLSQALPYLVNSSSVSGWAVTRDSVLGLPGFRRAVEIKASAIARLTLCVVQENEDGSQDTLKDHPAYKLLTRRPCGFYPPFLLKQSLALDTLINGQAFCAIERDPVYGVDPVSLVRLDPDQVDIIIVNGELGYVWHVPGQKDVLILGGDMIHLRNLGDGVCGISVIDSLKSALGLAGATQQFAAEYYRWSATPTVILEVPATFKNPEELENLARNFEQRHTGLQKTHRVAVLQGGIKMSDWKISAQDAALIESRKLTLIDVANIVGISANRLGAELNTSYGSLEAEQRAFLVHDLEPSLVAAEEEYSLKMLTEDELDAGVRIEFDRRWMEIPDAATQSKIDIDEVNNGLKSVNEKRAERREPRIAEDWADQYRMPANLTYAALAFETADQAEDQADGGVDEAQEGEDKAQAPQDAPEAPQDAPDAPAADNQDYHALLKIDVERVCTRLSKACEAQGAALDLNAHRAIVCRSVPPLAPQIEALCDELEAVLPEQRQKVLDRFKESVCPS